MRKRTRSPYRSLGTIVRLQVGHAKTMQRGPDPYRGKRRKRKRR